jgi:hypothetical protein
MNFVIKNGDKIEIKTKEDLVKYEYLNE